MEKKIARFKYRKKEANQKARAKAQIKMMKATTRTTTIICIY